MKKVEEMTKKEMQEFAAKAEIIIPKELKSRADILEFLKNPNKDKEPESPTPPKPAGPTPQQIQADRDKRAAKVPLTEADKSYLANLEKMARLGNPIPNSDQMKDLRILRMRKAVTPLSAIEIRELEELNLKAEGAQLDGENVSGLPDPERREELLKRSEICEPGQD